MVDFSIVREIDLIFYYRHMSRFSHTFHKEEHGDKQSNFDRDCQIEDNRQEESHQQHRHIAFRILHQRTERPPFAHIIRNDNQYACQASHRDMFGQRT